MPNAIETIHYLTRSLQFCPNADMRKRYRLLLRDAENSFRYTYKKTRSARLYNETQRMLKNQWSKIDQTYDYILREIK